MPAKQLFLDSRKSNAYQKMSTELLKIENLTKSFDGVPALKNGQFTLEKGTIHALCGGNGAGKSTFLSIVMGIQKRDGGKITFNGSEVEFNSPSEALAAGISIIEQELSPVPAMTVAENMFLGREPLAKFGRIDFKKMNAHAQAMLDELNFSILATEVMMDLPVAKIQLVEIAKALSYRSDVIIMDEPTSALGEAEADQLFEAIRILKERGKGVIYVSHRLSEIFSIADSYTVFRDGQYVGDGSMSDIDRESLIQMIVGRPLTEEFVKDNVPTSTQKLRVEFLAAQNGVRDINFSAHKGEIVALYGLMGSGRSEIFERLFGLSPHIAGDLFIDGIQTCISSPSDAIERGLAFVTEDRKRSGLVLSAHVRSNICLAHLDFLGFGPIMNTNLEASSAAKMIEQFSIKTSSDLLEVSGLSGGNQQKVVLGKWFLTNPEILLLDEPTRGVDVGAKREIYKVISDFASDGGTVIFASSEIDEVLGMADRVIVMKNGRLAGEVGKKELTAERLVHLAA